MASIKLVVKGKGQQVILSDRDFISSGGEGSVYAKGGLAYKVCNSPAHMIPVGKIQELSVLTKPNIVKPIDVLVDEKGVDIGYSMALVPTDSYVMCQLFPRSFRDREHFDTKKAIGVVTQLREGVSHCHSADVLIVDLNEMNFLVGADFRTVYFIDTNSYQTRSYPATALMESVRDRHSKTFNKGTDWLAFGIVAFQVFVGIHPYKGKHPTLKTLDERMLANVSVFSKDVGVPGATLPFTVIPQSYKDWFQAVFDKGVRVAPPDAPIDTIVLIPVVSTVKGSNIFSISEILSLSEAVVDFQRGYAITAKGVYRGKDFILPVSSRSHLAFLPVTGKPVLCNLEPGETVLTDLTKKAKIPFQLPLEDVMSYDGRLIGRVGDNIVEVMLMEAGLNIMAGSKVLCSCLPNSTKFYDGVVVQNVLGSYYASISPASGVIHQVRLKEIEGSRLVNASMKGTVLVVVSAKNGVYNRAMYRFSNDFSQWDVVTWADVPSTDINFTLLPNGVVLLMNESDELEILSSKIGVTAKKSVKDNTIDSSCTLATSDTGALFLKGSSVYSFTMGK